MDSPSYLKYPKKKKIPAMYGLLCQFPPLYSQLWFLKSSRKIARLRLIPESLRFRPGGIFKTNPPAGKNISLQPYTRCPFSPKDCISTKFCLLYLFTLPSLPSAFPFHAPELLALLGPLQQPQSPSPVAYFQLLQISSSRSSSYSQQPQSQAVAPLKPLGNPLPVQLSSFTYCQGSSQSLFCPPLFLFC